MTKAAAVEKPEGVAKGKLINRTGTMASPLDSKAQAEAPANLGTTAPDGKNLILLRGEYAKEARPVGTVPPPLSIKGVGKAVSAMLKGKRASVVIDKVAERLAFERSGVRLYQGLVGKVDSRGTYDGGPTRKQLVHFQQEELAHFHMLCEAMKTLGGDPTAMTPSADVAAVESMGIVQVISDPRTTLPQALHAILVAELVDNDCWDLLIQLVAEAGQDQLVERFRTAKAEEDAHLGAVRDWLLAYGSSVLEGKDVDALTAR